MTLNHRLLVLTVLSLLVFPLRVSALGPAIPAQDIPTSGDIRINEVDPGAIQAVELTNIGSQPVLIEGWHLLFYNKNIFGVEGIQRTYTFPDGFVLNPGAYVVVREGSGTDNAATLYIGETVDWPGSGAVNLTGQDHVNTSIDFMRFGEAVISPPETDWDGPNPVVGTFQQTLGRNAQSVDLDDGRDWCAQTPSLGAQNTATCALATGEVVLNEVRTEVNKSIELLNVDNWLVDLSGWRLYLFNDSGLPPAYIFPAATILEPGDYLLLHSGGGTDRPGHLYLNQDIPWKTGRAIRLDDNSDITIDYVRFGMSDAAYPSDSWSGVNPIAPPETQSLGRYPNGIDTNAATDWCIQAPTSGAANTGCQLPDSRNLIQNGDFSDGETSWRFFGPVAHSVLAGFERLYHLTTPGSAGFYQAINHSLPANAPMEVKIGLGNSSNHGKVIAVVLRDPTWTDIQVCYFDLPARTPVQIYTMRGMTMTAHNNMVFATYLYPNDGKPMVWVDAISVRHRPSMPAAGTECIRPIATPNINLIANGEFGEGTASWDFGTLVRQVWENVLYMFRQPGTVIQQSLMYQVTMQRIPANMPVEMTLDLGNTSSSAKQVIASLHNRDWSDNYVCYFNIPANSPRQTYTLRGQTSVPWERLVLVFYVNPDDGQPAIMMDNVNVQYKPGLSVSGLECIHPASGAAAEAIAPPDTTPEATTTQPTPETTIESVFGPDRTFELVEAEDDILVRRGLWSITDSSTASGTGYIFSGGNADDTLTLAFYGDAVEVIYVQHPALGSFAVEVDGEIRATVDTTAPESAFGSRVVIDGLAESEHQLRIIPTDGAIAIDALVVEGYFETSGSLD